MNFAYLHGFASSSKSVKGRKLAERFGERGIELHRPDLNVPSFEELTYTGMVEAVTDYDEEHGGGEPWSFIGSSMGGYVATRWAQFHPERVGRLLLLSPGFDMGDRWAEILGEQGMQDWEEEGSFLFFDPEDKLAAVHWDLYADSVENHPPYPEIDHPVRVLHGRDDEIVPVESSRVFVERTPGAELVLLEDNHKLRESVDEIAEHAFDFFDLQ